MKKNRLSLRALLAATLVVGMLTSLAVPAFAATTTTPTTYEVEPNNAADDATMVSTDTDITGSLVSGTSADSDYYLFVLTEPKLVSITYTGDTAIDGIIHLYSGSNTTLQQLGGTYSFLDTYGMNNVPNPYVSSRFNLPAGRYTLRVESRDRTVSQPYTLRIDTQSPESTREVEENGDKTLANTLSFGQTITANIATEKDVDYYKITLTEATEIVLTFNHDRGTMWYDPHYALDFRDADGQYAGSHSSFYNKFTGASVTLPLEIQTTTLDAGDYYLKVSQSTAEYSDTDYSVTLSLPTTTTTTTTTETVVEETVVEETVVEETVVEETVVEETTTTTETVVDATATPTGDSVKLESLTPMSVATYNNWEDTDAYGYGGPSVADWLTSDLSNVGLSYDSGVKYATTGSWSPERFTVDYYLAGGYTAFAGQLVIHENEKSNSLKYYVNIYGDGTKLYASNVITTGTLPQSFSVDLTGVTKLTIEAVSYDDDFYRYEYLGVVNALLYTGGTTTTTETTTTVTATGATTPIESLTPMSLTTYNNWEDTDAYGYGGPSVADWLPSDTSNVGLTYDSGVKYATTGSWMPERFTVDYYLAGGYTSFAGQVVIHEDEKSNSLNYYVNIYGDGTKLFTSSKMTTGTLPQSFSVDLTGVTKLTIEAVTYDHYFYRYDSLGLVNALLYGGTTTTSSTTIAPVTNPTAPSVGASSWAEAEVNTGLANGFVPSELQSDYTANITRAEFAKLITQMLMAKTGTLTYTEVFAEHYNIDLTEEPFADTDDQYVKIAYGLQIINGDGSGNFNPDSTITRQEAATMLSRAASVLEFTAASSDPIDFVDFGSIAVWAQTSVNFISANGVMGGVGNDYFDPYGLYTREQSIITALRLYDAFPRTSYALN